MAFISLLTYSSKAFTGKISFLLPALILASISSAYAQSWEIGGSYLSVKINGHTLIRDHNTNELGLSDVEGSISFLCASGGLNVPLYNFTDEISLGLQASGLLGAGITYGGDGKAPQLPGFNIGIPAYLTFRAGAGSNRNSRLPVGLGLGLGYQYTAIVAEAINDSPDDQGFYHMTAPAAMIEVAFDFGRRSFSKYINLDNVKFRYEQQLGKVRKNYYDESLNLAYGYNFRQSNISMVYFLDYR